MKVKKTSILYAVTKKIYDNFPSIPVFALNEVEALQQNAFYVDLLTVSRASEAYGYVTKQFTIDVMYKRKRNDRKEIYMDMEDDLLDSIFIEYLDIPSDNPDIRNRKPRIKAQESNITDDILHCLFDIEFIDKIQITNNYDTMEDLRVKFKLVEEVINPVLQGGTNVT